MPVRSDVVIVGGGHNGLVAAAYIARAGLKVTVLERGEVFGGAATSATVFPGRAAWLSRYAYLISLLPDAILADLELTFRTARRRVLACTPYRTAEGEHRAVLAWPDDPTRTRASAEQRSWKDWAGLAQIAAWERALATRVWPSLLEPLRTREQWEESLRTEEEKGAWRWLVDRPLGEVFRRCVTDELLRGIPFTNAKIGVFVGADDPSLLQNRCYLLHVVGGGTGEWQVPVGGMGALSDELASKARVRGASLHTRAEVLAVSAGGASHEVVFRRPGEDAEQTVTAKWVLINAGPQVAARLLGRPHVPRPADEGSVFKVNMLLRRLPRLRSGLDPALAFAGTFHVNEGYEAMERSHRQAAAGAVPDAPPFEVYCHSLSDPSILGPELQAAGYQTLTLFGLEAPHRVFEREHARQKERYLANCLAPLNEFLVDPVEDCLASDVDGRPCLEAMTPQDLEKELALNQGNIFHGELSWFFAEEGSSDRWGVETGVPGVLRCGAAAARGGGVSGIPGHNAAAYVLEREAPGA